LRLADRLPDEQAREKGALMTVARAASVTHDETRLQLSIARLLGLHGTTALERAAIHRFAYERYTALEQLGTALAHAQAAYDSDGEPNSAEILHKAALKAGVLSVALRTASVLCQVRHHGDAYCSGRNGTKAMQ